MRAPRLLVVVLAVLVAPLASSCDTAPARPGTDWSLTMNRVWISHLPKSETEFARTLIFLEKPEFRIGGDVEASSWRIVTDLFEWKKTLTGADVRFPQFERDERWTLHAWKCKDDAPRPFDLCLVVKDGEKERRFFSADEWKIDLDAIDDADDLADAAAGVVKHARGAHE
jgi:hypothetical protein